MLPQIGIGQPAETPSALGEVLAKDELVSRNSTCDRDQVSCFPHFARFTPCIIRYVFPAIHELQFLFGPV